MNINKNDKRYGKVVKNIKKLNFIPILSLFHVLISTMLRFDKSIHPVVLYEYFIICICMKNMKTLKKNEGKSRKNYKPGR